MSLALLRIGALLNKGCLVGALSMGHWGFNRVWRFSIYGFPPRPGS